MIATHTFARRLCSLVLSIPLLGASVSFTCAQQQPTVQSLQLEIAEWQRASAALGDELETLQAERNSGYVEAVKSYHASLVDHYAYQAELRDQARDVLRWQLFSAYVLLGLVALVVTLGVVLSFLEVRSGLATSKILPALQKAVAGTTPPPAPADAPAVDAVPGVDGVPAVNPAPAVPAPAPTGVDYRHSITLSATSLQVTSAITGVIILVISLGFLYLFVDKVLELKPVDLITQNQPSDLPAGEAKAPEAETTAAETQ